LGERVSDGRPVVKCIVAWWSDKRFTPIVRPKGDTRGPDGTRHVCNAAMTLEDAETFAGMGFEVIVDPFDMEALIRWEQIERSKR